MGTSKADKPENEQHVVDYCDGLQQERGHATLLVPCQDDHADDVSDEAETAERAEDDSVNDEL